MGSPLKFFLNKTVVFVSTSVEADLMFPPNELTHLLMESALARAQHHHPVRVISHLFEATHAHLMLAVDNPEDIPGFMGRFKTESAHYVNRLLGRKKRTVWCEGYDSQTILDPGCFVRKSVYIFTNPAKDGLEDSVDHYPGLSTWKTFLGDAPKTKICPWIRRSAVPKLKSFTPEEYQRVARQLRLGAKEHHTLTVYPEAWLELYRIKEKNEKEEWREKIIQGVYKQEAEYRELRKEEKKTVMGAEKLKRVAIGRQYQPERSGRKKYCSSDDPELEAEFMALVRERLEERKLVRRRWRAGDRSAPYPLGLFPPNFPKLAEPWQLLEDCA